MARRSDHSKEELTQLFLDSARRFAEAEGLAGIGARRIARDVGYTPGTIYNLFGSLDGLILQLRAETLDSLYEVGSAVSMGGDPAQNLHRLAGAYTGYVGAHPRLWGVVFEHRMPQGETPQWYIEKVQRLLGLVEAAIAPLFRPGDEAARHHEARVLWASMHGIVTLDIAGKGGIGESAQALANSLIGNYVAGLRARGEA